MSAWQAAQAASPTYFTSGRTLRNGVGKVSRGSGGGGSRVSFLSGEVPDGDRTKAYQAPPAAARRRRTGAAHHGRRGRGGGVAAMRADPGGTDTYEDKPRVAGRRRG